MPLPDASSPASAGPRRAAVDAVHVSTAQKIEMIERAVDAGFPKVEVTSFSHPSCSRSLPTRDVLKGLNRRPGASYVVLMPTPGASTAGDLPEGRPRRGRDHPDDLVQRAHNKLNFRMGHDEAMAEHAAIMKRAQRPRDPDHRLRRTVYGCRWPAT